MRTIAAVIAVALVACSGGERQIAGPGDGPGTPGTSALTVRVGLADADLARTLGWEGGVPGVEVHALRNGEGTQSDPAAIDSVRSALTADVSRIEPLPDDGVAPEPQSSVVP